MSVALAKVLWQQASENAPLSALVSGRIYVEHGPKNPMLPLIIISYGGSSTEQFQSSVRHEASVTAEVFMSRDVDYSTVMAIDDALYTACEGASRTDVAGFDRGVILCRSRGALATYDDAYGVTSEWTVNAWQ